MKYNIIIFIWKFKKKCRRYLVECLLVTLKYLTNKNLHFNSTKLLDYINTSKIIYQIMKYIQNSSEKNTHPYNKEKISGCLENVSNNKLIAKFSDYLQFRNIHQESIHYFVKLIFP